MVKISGIEKKFGKLKVLQGLNLDIETPGVIALLGPNGSGKTTLLKCILGMVIPDSGDISVNGMNIKGEYKYRSGIDYLPQIARFPDNITVAELFMMIGDIRGNVKRKAELIELFKLDPFLGKKLGHLSGGTRQKVNIVLAFMFDNNIIILDEPSAGLDPVSLIKLKNLIRDEKQRGKLILLTTHIMGLVEEIADEIIFILEGQIFFRGTISLLQSQMEENSLENAIAKLLIEENVEDR